MSRKLPVVAIVGRANVGKSSLFNALLKNKEAVVAREAGTTRDAVYRQMEYGEHHFWLIDTAGLKSAEDEFEATIQDQIEEAAAAADVILVVVEAGVMITDEDRRVAKKALKSKKPVILITNKADQAKRVASDKLPVTRDSKHSSLVTRHSSPFATPWQNLGIKEMIATSATQNIGLKDTLAAITQKLPVRSGLKNDGVLRIALLGRPNVGKSALFNTLAKKQQAIVANIAGTTRDVNRVRVRYEGRDIELLDTAGIRKSGRIEKGIEKFSVLRSLQAIEEADVCLLLTDVNEIATALDQKIAGMIAEAGKGLVLVVSKWDTLDKTPYSRDQIAPQIQHHFQFVPWAPLIFTSAETGQNVTKLFDIATDIYDRRQVKLKTADLNRALSDSLQKHPPAGLKNRHPKPRYLVQDAVNPPTFRLYGAHLEFLHWSWKRYLEKALRSLADFNGTPIKLYMMNNQRQSQKTRKFLPKAKGE